MRRIIIIAAFIVSAFSSFSQSVDKSVNQNEAPRETEAQVYERIQKTLAELDQKGLDTAGLSLAFTNNFFFEDVFKHVTNKEVLKRSVIWMRKIVEFTPHDQINLDTYANLLYKLGAKAKAIALEEKAWQMEIASAKLRNTEPDSQYEETLIKMRAGKKTWE